MAVEIDPDAYDFGYRLQQRRKLKGWSQAELSKRIGVSKQTISSYENNSMTPSLSTAKELARILNSSLDYLLGLDNVPVIKIQELTQEEIEFVLHYIRVYHDNK